MRLLKWVGAALLLSLSGCDFGDSRDVVINGETYRIPKHNITVVAGDAPELLDQGFDRSNLVLGLSWEPDVVSKAVLGFQPKDGADGALRSIVSAGIYFPAGRDTSQGSGILDALLLSGRFADAAVKFDKELHLYKVIPSNDMCIYYLSMKPDKNIEIPEKLSSFWKGKSCEFNLGGTISEIMHYSDNMYFEIKIGGPNFHLRNEIKKFVVSQLDGWRLKE